MPTLKNKKNGKKNLATQVERIRQAHPDCDVQLWAMDEHRAGLKPVMRRVWVDEWTTPIAKVNWKFEWLWLYAFVHPDSGQTYWWILPYVNTGLFSQVLADFAAHFKVGKTKRVALVVDQAGWHTSEQVQLPEGIDLIFLPAYSPELQPAERLWTLTNESVANRSFKNLDELEEVLMYRCRQLLKRPEFIQGLTRYHWWASVTA